MTDAKNILDLMTVAHLKEDQHFKNIEFMHHDHKYALVLEIIDINDNSGDKREIEEIKEPTVTDLPTDNPIIGCVKYEWMKFNFWDWRESDWEDYDTDNIYSIGSNGSYERRRMLRESGVRVDNFIRILDICISPFYQNKGLGSQLLQSLIYAFPSNSKFGIEVNAENTTATKCITKCKFKIARMEQQYGMRYKMTTESNYTFSQYQSFLNNSQVVIPKPITIQISSNSKQRSNNKDQMDDDSCPVTPENQKQRDRRRHQQIIRVQEDQEDMDEEIDYHGM